MPAESDLFIVSTFAQWAGDQRVARTLLMQCQSAIDAGRSTEPMNPTLRLLGLVAHERLEELARREHLPRGRSDTPNVTAKPVELRTAHLQGVVWRTDDREFLLQAYLLDLSLETAFFARVTEASSRFLDLSPAAADSKDASPSETPVFRSLGAAWVLPGDPFLRVQVSDMGLIEALALWTGSRLDEEAGAGIRAAFQRLLEALDPAGGDSGSPQQKG